MGPQLFLMNTVFYFLEATLLELSLATFLQVLLD